MTVSEVQKAFNKLENQPKTWQKATTGQKWLNTHELLSIAYSMYQQWISMILLYYFYYIVHDLAKKKKQKNKNVINIKIQ